MIIFNINVKDKIEAEIRFLCYYNNLGDVSKNTKWYHDGIIRFKFLAKYWFINDVKNMCVPSWNHIKNKFILCPILYHFMLQHWSNLINNWFLAWHNGLKWAVVWHHCSARWHFLCFTRFMHKFRHHAQLSN